MPDFISFFNKLSPLEEGATKDLLSSLKTKTFKKGDLLLKEGTVCKHLYFIDQGLVKTFFYKNKKEFIMRFFQEHVIFSILESYLTKSPSRFMIMALEPTTVTYISQSDMDRLCTKYHCVETLFRKLISISSVNMMKRISILLEDNATERYNHFVAENNALLQRISLGDLACYLGITQVSLSRIRARK
jgi:CRP-like cAMP-binding protein